MHLVLICFSTYARLQFSKKSTKNNVSTYVQYQTSLTVIINSPRNLSQPDETQEPPKNGETLISDIPNDTPNQHYHNCDVAHATEVKYESNRYITPVNVKFGSTESDSTVNIPSKYRKIVLQFLLKYNHH